MTTNIIIRAHEGSSLHEKLFFPFLANELSFDANVTGDANGHGGGEITFSHGGWGYLIKYQGTSFGLNPSEDIHGNPTSATLYRVGHFGGLHTIATMEFDTEKNVSANLDTAAWLTPESLSMMNSYDDSVKMSFYGADGHDVLFGTSSGDLLYGGTGNDTLTGNSGEDQFVFDAIGRANVDHIVDFQKNLDSITLDLSGNTVFAGVTAKNLEHTFHDITKEAEQSDDRIIYNHHTGDLSYDPDGSGDQKAVIFAHLHNHAKLFASSFEVI